MSEIISSRRSFLVGFGALIAAPAIVRASSIMSVKQMLILPPRLDDVTFPIEGYARTSPEFLRYHAGKAEVFGEWKRNWTGKAVPVDANERWESLKKRSQSNQWDAKITHALDYAERIKQNAYQFPEWKTS